MSTSSDSNSYTAFTAEDLDRIRREAPVEHLEFHQELDSTNTLALQLTGMKELPLPMLVLAETQTSGRGQRTRQWWSSAGALTFSLIIDADESVLPPEQWPKVSLTTGLAISEALEDFIPGELAQIKWPNDVYVQCKKICGILIESQNGLEKRLVIGIGINVNNSVFNAPEDVAPIATSICDMNGESTALVDVLLRVVQNLVGHLRGIATSGDELGQRWRKRCYLTGRRVLVDYPTDRLEGLCQGIDRDGALLVQTADGTQRCLAGMVTVLAE